MNTFKIGTKLYKYELFWRNSKKDKTVDFNNKILPYPSRAYIDNNWQNKDLFLSKLHETQVYLKKNKKFQEYKKGEYKDCLICSKKDITTGLFTLNGIRWEDGLVHYLDVHNVKPSDKFIDYIFRHEIRPKVISRHKVPHIKGRIVVKNSKKYLKIDKNQILIMDALMEHGGSKRYVDKDNKKIYRYSEHAGLLDFNNDGLEKVIVYGNTTRVDRGDNEIFLPGNLDDAFDYEYIFHTHPPTPKPGGRADVGIIYEFPSISDIFHFMDHYNEGNTQGSIIVAAEGLYIIRKKIKNNKKIRINEDNFYRDVMDTMSDVQYDAMKKYGKDFTTDTFFSKIAQNKTYIGKINSVLNRYGIHVDFFSRIKDGKNNWIIDTIYLPVYVVEAKK